MTHEQMRNIDIRTVDKGTLVDATDVIVNMDSPKTQRMIEITKQLGNPYCFKYGGIAVKLEFADTTASINDRIESLMRTF